LQLQLLRDRFEHELDAVERRGEVGLEADVAAVRPRRVEAFEDTLGELDPGLRPLERLVADVVQRGLHAGSGEHPAHSRAPRPGPRARPRPAAALLTSAMCLPPSRPGFAATRAPA